jgi:hypothetical protein
MNLTYQIAPDRRTLTIFADDTARAELRELPDTLAEMEAFGLSVTIHSDDAMIDAFDRLIANSELDWIRPEETGDLTDAPILGIRKAFPNGCAAPLVLERWGFMSYQVRSVLQDLRDTGRAVFVAP